jgi:cytochrome b involved in lipid metabolism
MSESDVVVDQQGTKEIPVTESENLNTEERYNVQEEQKEQPQVETQPSETNEEKQVEVNKNQVEQTQETKAVVPEASVQDVSSSDEAKEVSQPVEREEPKVEIKEEVKEAVREEVKQPEPAQTRELKEYTLDEIAKHDKADDCWIIINNTVYDVTPFVATHPGGVAILRNAGKDSTVGFDKIGSHKKKANVDDHLSKAQNLMTQFVIGTVKPSEVEAAKQVEVDPEDILAQCLAEAEEKVKVETQARVVEPTVTKPVAQPTTASTQQPKATTPVVQPTVVTPQKPQQQPTTTTTTPQKSTIVSQKKPQPTQPAHESSTLTWVVVGGAVAVAAVGAYAYFSNRQKI